MLQKRILAIWMTVALLASNGCFGASAAPTTVPDEPIPVEVPALPFADNADPTLCGIPEPDDRRGIAIGEFEGEVVQPIVYLYNSHSRSSITGQVFPGTELQVELSQTNPTLNFYFVRTINVEPAQSGWIPAPFIQFE